jgi:hypothetical protein
MVLVLQRQHRGLMSFGLHVLFKLVPAVIRRHLFVKRHLRAHCRSYEDHLLSNTFQTRGFENAKTGVPEGAMSMSSGRKGSGVDPDLRNAPYARTLSAACVDLFTSPSLAILLGWQWRPSESTTAGGEERRSRTFASAPGRLGASYPCVRPRRPSRRRSGRASLLQGTMGEHGVSRRSHSRFVFEFAGLLALTLPLRPVVLRVQSWKCTR